MPGMRRTLAACLAAVALLGLAACGEGATTVAETGTTTTTEATSTSEGEGGSTDDTSEDGSSTTGGEGSSTTSSTQPVGTSSSSTTEPATAAETPEDAAGALFGAWQAGDESAAPEFAEQSAVDDLFAEEAAGFADATDEGCTADDPAASWACAWTADDQVLTMRVEGSDTDGWRVVSVTFDPA
jgi:hypothetical protein